MGGEDHRGARRNGVQLIYEDRTLPLQRLDHMTVVNDFVADIDGGTVAVERPLHDPYGSLDAGAEAARPRQQDRKRPKSAAHTAIACPERGHFLMSGFP